jgi:hypothetical protein
MSRRKGRHTSALNHTNWPAAAQSPSEMLLDNELELGDGVVVIGFEQASVRLVYRYK